MKSKIITLVTIFFLISNTQVEAKGFWKKLGKAIGSVAEAAVVVAADRTIEKHAPEQAAQYRQSMQELNEQSKKRVEEENKAWEEYSQYRKNELQKELSHTSDYETRELIRQEIAEISGISPTTSTSNNTSLAGSLLSEVGIKQQNIQRGMAWNEAQNKYERQNILKDYIFDAAGNISGNTELLKKFRQILDAQNTYLSENSKAMTTEEKQAALDKRNLEYFNIGYDTYQEAQDRKSQHLAEKLKIQQQLIARGWYNDSQLANEVAGSIIAVQKSKLSEKEKTEILRGYGFSESPVQIQQYVNEVLNDDYVSTAVKVKVNEEAERIKAEQDAQRQAKQKVAEERRNAIKKIETTKLDYFLFDKTSLSQNQKSILNDVADILNRYSDIKVLIIGHTCNIGYKNINQRVGLRRAESAKEFLVEKGISQERISVDSKGESLT